MRVVNLQGSKFNKTIELQKVTALTKSLDDDNFLLHQENLHDYQFKSSQRDQFIYHLKECYFKIKKDNLPIYGIKGGLDKYRTPKKSKVINLRGSCTDGILPPDQNRLIEEDVFDMATACNEESQPTYEESTKLTTEESKKSINTSPFVDARPSNVNESLQSLRYRSLASQFVQKQRKILVNRYEWIKAVGEGAFGQVVLCNQISNQQ